MTADDVDGHVEEDEGRDIVSQEWAGARQYSARQRDRLYPVEFAGSSLNFSDGRLTEIDVLYGCRLGIHQIGDAEGRWQAQIVLHKSRVGRFGNSLCREIVDARAR